MDVIHLVDVYTQITTVGGAIEYIVFTLSKCIFRANPPNQQVVLMLT